MHTSRRLRCVALVLLVACGRRAPIPPHSLVAVTAERQFQVREAELENGAITVHLEIPLEPAGPKPAVLGNLNESLTMLGDGVVVVTYKIDWARLKGAPPPAAPGGEKAAGTWALASPSAALIGEQYLRQITATATLVIPRVIDYLATVPDVDMTRLGITGGSTNGFIALRAIAADRRLGVATAVAACGDYEGFLRESSMGMKGRPLALDPAYRRWLRAEEPNAHAQQMVHAALLMVNRESDPLIPIGCAEATRRVLAPAFARAGRSSRFRFVRVEAAAATGHGVGPRENAENTAWLRRWLLDRSD